MRYGAAKYEILEHRGDFKIRVFGKNKKELFLNALLGMESGLRPKIKNCPYGTSLEGRQKSALQNIKIKSFDQNALLVDFLNEVLYLIQTNKEVYGGVKFNKFTDTEIEAELSGQKVERFGEDIKAVTYHDLDVHQKENGIWETTILFDV